MLSRLYPDARLIFTGGNASLLHRENTEAAAARQFFREMGVPEDRVSYEDQSRNTYENARFTRDLIRPKYAIPFHYGTFPPLRGTPAEYMQALGSTSTKVLPINPGDTVEF